MKKTTRLTDTQRALIDWFQLEMTDVELKELNRMFTRYYADKITRAMDKLFEEKGWGPEKNEEWRNEHMRTPYKPNKPTTESFFVSIEELEEKFYKNRTPKLTNTQLEILKQFKFETSEEDVLAIKDLLFENYGERITSDIDEILKNKYLTQKKVVQISL